MKERSPNTEIRQGHSRTVGDLLDLLVSHPLSDGDAESFARDIEEVLPRELPVGEGSSAEARDLA